MGNSSVNARPQSSQLTEPLWTDPGLKSKISVCDLISTSKKKKITGREWIVEHSPKIFTREKKPPLLVRTKGFDHLSGHCHSHCTVGAVWKWKYCQIVTQGLNLSSVTYKKPLRSWCDLMCCQLHLHAVCHLCFDWFVLETQLIKICVLWLS